MQKPKERYLGIQGSFLRFFSRFKNSIVKLLHHLHRIANFYLMYMTNLVYNNSMEGCVDMNNRVDHNNKSWRVVFLAFSITVFIVTTACGDNTTAEPRKINTDIQETSAVDDKNKSQDSLVEQFRTTVSDAKETGEIISFLNENLAKAGENNADIMIRELNAFYDADLERTQDAFFQPKVQESLMTLPWPITSANAGSIADDEIKRLVVTKLSGGYKLVQVEGSIYPIVDYEMQKKMSSEFLSEPMNHYISLKAMESNEMTAKDGGLVISWDELADRAVSAETFVKRYPDSPEWEEVKQSYLDRYLSMYIIGLINTPVFDYETYKLKDEVRSSYEKLIKEQPITVTAKTAQSFMDVLVGTKGQVFKQINGQQTEIAEVKQFQDRFLSEAEAMLKPS